MKNATLEDRAAELARREAELAADRKALNAEREAERLRVQVERAAARVTEVKAVRDELERETGALRLPEALRSRLWGHAWREGHAYAHGYESLKTQYRKLMELLEGFEVSPMQ